MGNVRVKPKRKPRKPAKKKRLETWQRSADYDWIKRHVW